MDQDGPKEHPDCKGQDGSATGTSGGTVEEKEDGLHGVKRSGCIPDSPLAPQRGGREEAGKD